MGDLMGCGAILCKIGHSQHSCLYPLGGSLPVHSDSAMLRTWQAQINPFPAGQLGSQKWNLVYIINARERAYVFYAHPFYSCAPFLSSMPTPFYPYPPLSIHARSFYVPGPLFNLYSQTITFFFTNSTQMSLPPRNRP